MKVFLFLALLGLVAAQSFTAKVLIRNDPNVIGTVSGTIHYDFVANRTAFDYTNIGGIKEFFEFGALTSLRFLVCDRVCQAETIKTPILRLFRDVAADTNELTQVTVVDENGQNARTCRRFQKAVRPAGGIQTVAVDANNQICQATFADGKTFDFFNVVGLQGNPFNARPGNCPQPQCAKRQDIVLVFDESGSIDSQSFIRERQFGIDFANTFTFSPTAAQMGLVQFDSSSRLTIQLTADRNGFVNSMSRITQNRGATCIGCGIETARIELNSRRARATATKSMVVLTDGQNNVNVNQFPGIVANAKVGITIAAIGVAQAVANEIRLIASAPNLAFFATDFAALNGILDGLATATCDDLVGNSCGAGCKGFCACNQQCLCPDICENNDNCINPICRVDQNGAGCQFPRNVVCNDNNACTRDQCVSPGGCVFTDISAQCNDGLKCTIDSCDRNLGCINRPVICDPPIPDPCHEFFCAENLGGNGCGNRSLDCDRCIVFNVVCPPIPCQINVCDPRDGVCRQTPKVCNSNNRCIIDSCDVATDQCVQTARVCDDGNACTDDSCDPDVGCVHVPFDPVDRCNDQSLCTDDVCEPAVGCINRQITCNRTDICKSVTCNSVLGCIEEDADCRAVLAVIDPNKQGDCYIAVCDVNRPNPANGGQDGCLLSQIPGTTIDRCGFCAAPGTQSPFCFLGLDLGATAALSGGVIAAIVIGAVVAAVVAIVSGKKGYDVWVKNRNDMRAAQANPMYEDSGRTGNNPFFEAKA